jgi:hypothetical protein
MFTGKPQKGAFPRIFRDLLFEKNPPNGAESSFYPGSARKDPVFLIVQGQVHLLAISHRPA